MPAITLNFDEETNEKLIRMYQNVNYYFNDNPIDLDMISHTTLMRIDPDFTSEQIKIIREVLEEMELSKFKLYVHGIGIFKVNKHNYILYFRPTYDENFQRIHREVWDKLKGKVEPYEEKYYSPKHFSPHITIHVRDCNKLRVLEVLDQILDEDLHFEVTVDRIVFMHYDEKKDESKIYVERILQ